MSSAITYVLGRLLGRGAIDIPRQILEVGFRDEWLDRTAPLNLENKIHNWVIKDRVVRDMELVQGEEIIIDLRGVTPYTSEAFSRIYNIPPELTNYREILSVSKVSYVPMDTVIGTHGGSNLAMVPMMANELTTAASQVMNSVSSIPNMSTARVDLVGHNVVRVSDRQRLQSAYLLTCYVTADDYLSNIPPPAYPRFANLCILAIKAYLFNKLQMMMGEHYLQRGQELGIFKSVVERWESAAEEYWTFLQEEWQATSYMFNETQHTNLLLFQISPGL